MPEPILPLPKEGFGSCGWWKDAIDASDKKVQGLTDRLWKKNVEAYMGEAAKKDDSIAVNVDFYNTEQKKAQLFFRTPEVILTPKLPGMEQQTVLFQEVLNHAIGPHDLNAAAVMDECLFDVLCPAGIMAMKIGYEAIADGTQAVSVGMGPDGMPVTMEAPRIVSEKYLMERLSPRALLLPADFHGSDYDKAFWKGFKFVMDLSEAKAKGWVPPDFSSNGEDKYRLAGDERDWGVKRQVVVGAEIWYQTAKFDPSVKHPDHMRRLVIIDGVDEPVVHTDSPYQRFDTETGKFLVGMKGSPVHVGAIRYVSDTAFPPSDCTIARPQVDEMSKGRTQMVQQRERSLPMRWVDRNRVGPEEVEKIKRGEVQQVWPVDGNGGEIIGEVARADYPRENFTFAQIAQNDIDRYWALGANQNGSMADTVRSATELSLVQQNTNVRLDYERGKVLAFYLKAVEKVASLIQMFADDEQYVRVVGPNGLAAMQKWDKTTIAGEYVFTAKADSTQRLDIVAERKNYLDFLNYMAKNPNANLTELTRIGAQVFGFDPSRVMQQPAPPPPEKPAISFRFSGADLALPEVRQILQTSGIDLGPVPSPQALNATMAQELSARPPHGGPADKASLLNKHQSEETGQMSGPTNAAAVN